MPRSAVALASTSEPFGRAPGAPDTGLQEQLDALGRQMGHGRRFRPGRSQVALVALAILGVWLVLVFGRTLTQLNTATERQAVLAAETRTLELRLQADRRELMIVQTDAFQGLQARAFGYGQSGEQVFSLPRTDSPAAPVASLGQVSARDDPTTSLESWLELLFGR